MHLQAIKPISERSTTNRTALRVLLVVESSAAGTGRHVIDLAEGLLSRGCEVHVIYSSRRVDQMFRDRLAKLDSVRSLSLPMRTAIHPSDLGMVRAVRRYLGTFGPFDIIHGHSSKGGAIVRLAALGTGVPAFYTIHGMTVADPGLARWKRMIYLSIELVLSRRSARIIAVSPEEQRMAIRLGLGAGRVIMIPNGVGPTDTTCRETARRAIGVGDEELVIGFVGRLVGQKAADVLLRAFSRVSANVPAARLAMVGSGPLLESLQQLALTLCISEKVIWLGECDARPIYPAFDLFAIASRKEGLPYVVLEAMAAGLPVVATDSAGVEILIENGVNGAVVGLGDVDRFADALLSIVRDAELRSRYGQASQQKARLFTIDRMVNQTLAAYHAALATAEVDFDDSVLATAEGELP